MSPGRQVDGDGPADCERRDDWFLAQDVNAWTSLAYLAVGIAVVVVVVHRRLPWMFLAFGTLVAVEGVGSLLYHGSGGDLAEYLHDVPMVGVLGFVAGWHLGRLADRACQGALAGMACGVTAGTAASALGGTNVAVGVLVVVIVVAELVARRRRLPAVWTAPVIALGVAAAATWLLGTSRSPLCGERSWAQPHGVWHLLSALVLFAWMNGAAAVPPAAPSALRR